MKTKFITLTLSLIMFTLTEINASGKILDFKRNYDSVFIEPLSYVSLAVAVSMFILLFFSDEIFNKWLKRFIYWYAPLAFIIILSGSTGSSYAWSSRSDFAILFGEILVAVTLIFALVQKFVYKK